MAEETKSVSRRDVLKYGSVAATAGLAGCRGITGSGNNQESVNLGWFTGLTGPFSVQSEPTQNAIDFLVSKQNDRGGVQGRDVEVEVFDTEGAAQTATSKARDFLDGGGDLMAGFLTTPEVQALQNLAGRREAPFVQISSSGESVPKNCNKFTGQPGLTPQMLAESSMPFVVEEFGTEVFQLNFDYSYGYQVRDNWASAIRNAGGEIIGSALQAPGETDFASALTQIEEADPDWVQFGLAGGAGTAFYTQFRQQGLSDIGIHCHTEFEQAYEGAGAEVINELDILTSRDYVYTIDTEENQTFVENFRDSANRPPSLSPGETILHIGPYLQAANQADNLEAGSIMQAYRGFETKSIVGDYSVRECDHQATYPIFQARVTGISDAGFTEMEIADTTDGVLPECGETGCNLADASY